MGRVRLLYRVRVQTDEDLRNQAADPDGDLHWSEVDLALIECFERCKLPDLAPGHFVYYLPQPEAVMYSTALENIRGRVSMQPYGDTGTITTNLRHLYGSAFKADARVDLPNQPGSGSPLYHLNTWAMDWATDPELGPETYDSDSDTLSESSDSDRDCVPESASDAESAAAQSESDDEPVESLPSQENSDDDAAGSSSSDDDTDTVDTDDDW